MAVEHAFGDMRFTVNDDNRVTWRVGDVLSNQTVDPYGRSYHLNATTYVAPNTGGIWHDQSIGGCLPNTQDPFGFLNDQLVAHKCPDGHELDPESIDVTMNHIVGTCVNCHDTLLLPTNPAQAAAAVVAELIAAFGNPPEGWLEKFDAAIVSLNEAREQIEDAYALIELARTKLKEKVS